MNANQPLLSLIIGARNDGYMGDFKWRLTTCLNYLGTSLEKLGKASEVEVLICDWGSETPLHTELELSPEARSVVRFIVVPPEIAVPAQKDSSFPIPIVQNAAIRRAKGKFIAQTDSDIIFTPYTLERLLTALKGGIPLGVNIDKALITSSRKHIPREITEAKPGLEELENYLNQYGAMLPYDKLIPGIGTPSGLALLHRSIWDACRGYDETLIHWGWMEIDLYLRIAMKYPWRDIANFGGDLYHIEHYPGQVRIGPPRKTNPMLTPRQFSANDENWGMADCDFTIIEAEDAAMPLEAESRLNSSSAEWRLEQVKKAVEDDTVSELNSVELEKKVLEKLLKALESPVAKRLKLKQEIARRNLRLDTDEARSWDYMNALTWFAEKFRPLTYLEVGAAKGAAATLVAAACRPVSMYEFDRWGSGEEEPPVRGPVWLAELVKSVGYEGYMRHIIGQDAEVLSEFFANPDHPRKFDLIFQNSEVSAEEALSNLRILIPRLAPGGALLFSHPSQEVFENVWSKTEEEIRDFTLITGEKTGMALRTVPEKASETKSDAIVGVTESTSPAPLLESRAHPGGEPLRILLLSPPGFQAGEEPIFPLGIGYLLSALNQEFEARAAAYQKMEHALRQIPELLKRFAPQVVGISCNTFNRGNARRLSQLVKSAAPQAKIVFGGVHPSFFYEQALKHYGADIVVIGEGESAIVELCRVLERKTPLDEVEGIAFLRDGETVRTAPRRMVENLDELPMPDYSYAGHLMRASGMGYLISSRGCPVNCIFCSTGSYWGQKVRKNSVNRVVDEMEFLAADYGLKKIFFHDDTFNLGTARVKNICQEIMRRGLKVEWGVSCRVHPVSQEMIDIMVEAGCRHICWGIESASEEMLRKINKKIKLDQIKKAYECCRRHLNTLSVGAFAMVGNPGESEKTIEETVSFLNKLPMTDNPSTALLYVLPGTALYETLRNSSPGIDSYWIQNEETMYYTFEQPMETLRRWSQMVTDSGNIIPYDRSRHFWNDVLFGRIPQPEPPNIEQILSTEKPKRTETEVEAVLEEKSQPFKLDEDAKLKLKSGESELDFTIPPEIKDDELYHIIEKLSAETDLHTVLEIGSSSGDGSTEAFVKGLKRNPNRPEIHCLEVSKPRFEQLKRRYAGDSFVKTHNVSSIALDKFPTEAELAEFYHSAPSALNDYTLERVQGWLRQDIEYVENSGVPDAGIARIKRDYAIVNFDMALIDGSEFTGKAELDEIYGAKFIILDDIDGFKNRANYDCLKFDLDYELIRENWKLRNGYAVFRRREGILPIHFFTIVLNGEPFIRHHIEEFRKLPFKWHWHIIEGVADLVKDTAWSLPGGGRITAELHQEGLSNDGTSEYLNELARKYPQNVTIYRKAEGKFWEGKLEMVDAPLENIKERCLLWQIDSDELWTAEQIAKTRELFIAHPEKTSAYFHCWYFVAPRKYVSSMNTWATYPEDWLRCWRFLPGMKWQSHEPPALMDSQGRNTGKLNPLARDETKSLGLTFQHFAYVTEAQVRFKEIYYGYNDAVEHWKRLCEAPGPVNPADYLPWAKDDAVVDDWKDSGEPLLSEKWLTQKPRRVKIAGQDQDNSRDLMAVQTESSFAQALEKLFREIKPRRIIETGTYLGTGSTAILYDALRKSGVGDLEFYSIEVNPEFYRAARQNLARAGRNVEVLNGVSVPRSFLPNLADIERMTVSDIEFDDIFVDHQEAERALLYFKETDFEGVPDDLLGWCLQRFDGKPDFVLLDSAGHMGNIEFNYLIERLQGECCIALDDVFHIKHYKSYRQIESDPRFELIHLSREKFGFLIAKFTPKRKQLEPDSAIKNILWVRTDSIGDSLLSLGMMEHIREKFPQAKITALCQQRIAELYQACPHLDSVIAFDKKRAYEDEDYCREIIERLQSLNFDLALNTVYSREEITDLFTLKSGAKETIAFRGNIDNIPEAAYENNNLRYTRLIPAADGSVPELERNREFLRVITGGEPPPLEPDIWISQEDLDYAETFFRDSGLTPEKTIAFAPAAQWEYKLYERYAEVLNNFPHYDILVIGGSDAEQAGEQIRNAFPGKSANIAGETTLRQTAAVLSRCRLYFGADTAGAHLACAVGTPNVVLLGGGHFGRFFPYSPLTTAVCLPLECYHCNWKCLYQRVHCIRDVAPEILSEAVEITLRGTSDRPRLMVQPKSGWNPAPGEPCWRNPEEALKNHNLEIIYPQTYTAKTAPVEFEEENQPLMSVVTPSYNQGSFIEKTIQSVLEQDYPNFEHIVMDGGSTDNSLEILKRYPHLIWKSEPDKGQSDALNKALRLTKGDIIAWINSDDWYQPGAFKAVAEFFRANPDKHIVMGDCNLTDKNGVVFDKVVNHARGFDQLKQYQVGNSIPTQPAVFFRRELINDLGWLDESLQYGMDYDLWMRFAWKHHFHHIDKTLANYRFHDAAKNVDQDWSKCLPEWKLVRDRYVNQAPPPKVSVIIPCYNYARYLPEAVESVARQTFNDFEIIIVDDGSTDNSAEVAARLKDEHPELKMRVIDQSNSGQPAHSRNRGIAEARGEYILCLDADDMMEPSLLEECVKALHSNPQIVVAYPDQLHFENGNSKIIESQDWDMNRLTQTNLLPTCAMFRREAWKTAGGYKTNVRGYEDWDFWISLGETGGTGHRIRKPLFLYRVNDSGVYADALERDRKLRAQIILNHPSLYDENSAAQARKVLWETDMAES